MFRRYYGRPEYSAETNPSVLQALDAENGTRLYDVHQTLREVYPVLSNVTIVPEGRRGGTFIHGDGLNNLGIIFIAPEIESNESFVDNGITHVRYGRFDERLARDNQKLSPQRLRTFELLHEFGHAKALEERIVLDLAVGIPEAESVAAMYDELRAVKDRFNETLSGYRETILTGLPEDAMGMDTATWLAYQQARERQYSLLPPEYDADSFALGFFEHHPDLLA
ncbi:MAG TPA: hypothetical protein VJP80_05125 [Candidatus Saccharimonadales bacterium]|nr:hypothetical protein [Candidatus Saccharimonadales bacterium]